MKTIKRIFIFPLYIFWFIAGIFADSPDFSNKVQENIKWLDGMWE